MNFVKSLLFTITAGHRTSLGIQFLKLQKGSLLPERFIYSGIVSCNQKKINMTTTKNNETVEAFACKFDDMKDGEMREIDIGNSKALLVRDDGKYTAVGYKCTHYGAQLVKGSLKNGLVRCPWHGACFNIATGDIEDYPGLDCIPKHEVFQNNDKVMIRAKVMDLTNNKVVKPMVQIDVEDSKSHFLIVGGGPTSVTCAETLRQKGFCGKITIATADNHLPYDRPKLSKVLNLDPLKILLRDQKFYDAAHINFMLGKKASQVNPKKQLVSFSDGEEVHYDQLLLATGGTPRTLPIPGWTLKNVCSLRSLDDATYISEQCVGKDVLICGASFIGMELASALISKAKSVTVCDLFSVPFEQVLGKEIGLFLKSLHESKGVKFCLGSSLVNLKGEDGKVKGAVLKNGVELSADIVVAGVGVVPATAFLKDCGISMTRHGYVEVDRHLRALKDGGKEPFSNVYAGGDIAMFPFKIRNWQPANVQHWQMAHYHGSVVGTNMVANPSALKPANSVPFFWTQQYGKSLRYTGYGFGYEDVVITGDVSAEKFCAYYTIGDDVVAVVTMMSDPVAAEVAQKMLAGEVIKKKDLK